MLGKPYLSVAVILAILITISFIVQIGNSQTLQQDTKLKTFYNPDYRFSIKYPDHNGEINISETTSDGPVEDLRKRMQECAPEDIKNCLLDNQIDFSKVHLNRVEFSHPNFIMIIEETESSPYIDIQRKAITDMTMLENDLGYVTIEDVAPVVYDLVQGYSWILQDPPVNANDSGILITRLYLDNGTYIYTVTVFVPHTVPNVKLTEEVLDSLKILK